MNVRSAKISDAKAINALINSYAERDRMLFRSLADIYENLQTFIVAELDETIIEGTVAIDEIGYKEKGIGRGLVAAAVEQAVKLGVPRVFALTLEPAFFEKSGFAIVEKEALPMKVWSDCARCSKQQNCDEIAVLKNVPRTACS